MHQSVRPADPVGMSALLARATQCFNAGRPAEAILALQEATRVAPGNAPVHHDLGFLCLQAGRLPEAIAALRTALALDPCFAQASLCLGIALQEQGDTPGALAAYRQALSLQPALTTAHVRQETQVIYSLKNPHSHALAQSLRATITDGDSPDQL